MTDLTPAQSEALRMLCVAAEALLRIADNGDELSAQIAQDALKEMAKRRNAHVHPVFQEVLSQWCQ